MSENCQVICHLSDIVRRHVICQRYFSGIYHLSERNFCTYVLQVCRRGTCLVKGLIGDIDCVKGLIGNMYYVKGLIGDICVKGLIGDMYCVEGLNKVIALSGDKRIVFGDIYIYYTQSHGSKAAITKMLKL